MTRKLCLSQFDKLKKLLTEWFSTNSYEQTPVKIHLGGSVAKETAVYYNEVDFFIEFTDSTNSTEAKLFEFFNNSENPEYKNYVLNYTAHKYLTLPCVNSIKFDIVPVNNYHYDTMSASIKHVEYKNKMLNRDEKKEVVK